MSRSRDETAVAVFAGGAAGAAGALATCPLEVLKTRLQSSHRLVEGAARGAVGSRTWAALSAIARKEGILGLWKGVGPTLVGVVPSRAVYFSVYSATKRQLAAATGSRDSTPVHFASAATAGCATATLSNPLWMVKTRMQLETGQRASGALAITAGIVRGEGVLALWKGMSASYLGVGETCLQWVLYEKLKQLHRRDFATEPGPLPLFCFASASKLTAAVAWYPHEVLRTRLREQDHPYRGMRDCLSRIVREEGVRRLYSGMGAHLLRAVPCNAITFVTFELIVRAAKLQ